MERCLYSEKKNKNLKIVKRDAYNVMEFIIKLRKSLTNMSAERDCAEYFIINHN